MKVWMNPVGFPTHILISIRIQTKLGRLGMGEQTIISSFHFPTRVLSVFVVRRLSFVFILYALCYVHSFSIFV